MMRRTDSGALPLSTAIALVALLAFCCRDGGKEPDAGGRNVFIATDAEVFALVTVAHPFGSYSLFPHVDSVARGTLNGSSAHQPLVRVRLNEKAASALHGGRLPAGASFPDGSIVFKEIIIDGTTRVYAVMLKDASNPLAANGWLWAEYEPNGNVLFSIRTQGVNCTACHAREQGPQHDFVRTFERQR